MRESEIERKMVRMVQQRGGLCWKFTSPGTPGVPDRIIITPDGRIYFVELKTEVGRMANIQKWRCEQLQKYRCDVRVLRGMDEVEAFIEEVMP